MAAPDPKGVRGGSRTPAISVITVSFNASATIEETLRSVCSQKDVDFEYLIIDGASTDATMDIVERYRDRIDRIVSEKDAGIFDAMNKGIALARGDAIYFLGADDTLVDDYVLRDIARAFDEDPERLLVYGNVALKGAPEGQAFSPAKPFRTWSITEFLNNSFCHQALFARRSLFTDVGLFDTRYRNSADYEWVIKVFKFRPRSFHFVDRVIANYFYFGQSQTQSTTTRKEVRRFYFEHLASFEMLWFYLRFVVLRGWKKKLLKEPW